jgi:hypothetical protein
MCRNLITSGAQNWVVSMAERGVSSCWWPPVEPASARSRAGTGALGLGICLGDAESRVGESAGLRNLPPAPFTQNQIWCEIVVLTYEPLTWPSRSPSTVWPADGT